MHRPATEMNSRFSSTFPDALSTLLSRCELEFSHQNQHATKSVPPYSASNEKNLKLLLEVVAGNSSIKSFSVLPPLWQRKD